MILEEVMLSEKKPKGCILYDCIYNNLEMTLYKRRTDQCLQGIRDGIGKKVCVAIKYLDEGCLQ